VILVDTSVWISHFREADGVLTNLLGADEVLTHPFVIGEIALGNLHWRTSVLADLRDLPRAISATDEEAISMIEGEQLFGLGIGYIDLHLLAATRLTPGARLWTRDERQAEIATRLGLAASV
jgi:predicted nucleic acid-binding protein